MTTPIYRVHRARLVQVNNLLWYAYLADAQAYPVFENASVSDPDGLTTQAFLDNPVVARICVRNRELPAFRERSIAAMAGIAFISAVEHLLRYMGEVQSFREKLSPSNVQMPQDTAPEEFLLNRLTAWGQTIESHAVRSMAYLRLRRNQVAHANEGPSGVFASFVRHNGAALNQYWAGKPAKLPGLDFAEINGMAFTQAESISLMNLCKICLVIIDEAVLGSIPVEVLEEREVTQFARNNKHLNGSSAERRYRKFKRYFEGKFGLTLKCDIQKLGLYWQESFP